MIRCPHCNTLQSDDHKICTNCSRELPEHEPREVDYVFGQGEEELTEYEEDIPKKKKTFFSFITDNDEYFKTGRLRITLSLLMIIGAICNVVLGTFYSQPEVFKLYNIVWFLFVSGIVVVIPAIIWQLIFFILRIWIKFDEELSPTLFTKSLVFLLYFIEIAASYTLTVIMLIDVLNRYLFKIL